MQVVVLNDGETYTAMQGCRVIDIPDSMDNAPDYEIEAYIEDAYDKGEGELVSDLLEANTSN